MLRPRLAFVPLFDIGKDLRQVPTSCWFSRMDRELGSIFSTGVSGRALQRTKPRRHLPGPKTALRRPTRRR